MKKIINILLTAALTASVYTPVFAAHPFTDVPDGAVDEAVDFMESFGIIRGYDDDTFRPDNNITRAEFAVCIARMMNLNEQDDSDKAYFVDVPRDHWAAGSIAQLTERGIISGYDDRTFGLNDNVRTVDAYKLMVSILGYDIVAEQNGGYPAGYIAAAQKADITNNVGSGELLTRANAAVMMFNTLNANTMSMDFSGSKQIFESGEGDTLLELYRKIASIEGTITSVPGTSIYGETAVGQTTMNIGDESFIIGDGVIADTSVLGQYVTAYYDDSDKNDPVIIYYYIHKNSTDEIIVNADDIDKDKTTSSRLYYFDGSRSKSVEIPSTAFVIYNGVAAGYDADTFKIDNGTIRLVQLKGESNRRLIFIDDVKTAVVSAVDAEKGIIYNKLGDTLDLEGDFSSYTLTDINGYDMAISQLAENNVLSVKKSANGRVDIIVSTVQVTGTISTVGSDGDTVLVTVNGEEYRVVAEYGEKMKISFSPSDSVILYLDQYGKAAFAQSSDSISNAQLAFMIKLYQDDDESYYCRLYTRGKEFVTYQLADTVKVDGKSCRSAERAWGAITDHGGASQLISYRLNSEGKVNYVDTPYMGTEENDYTLHVSCAKNSYVMKESGTMGGVGVLDADGIVFQIPDDNRLGNTNEYNIVNCREYFRTVTYNDFETYKLTPDAGKEKLCVHRGSHGKTIDSGTVALLVTKVTDGLNADGDVVPTVEVLSPNGKQVYYIESSYAAGTAYSKLHLKKGDLIRVGTGSTGDVNVVERVLDLSEPPVMGESDRYLTWLNSYYHGGTKFTYGYPHDKGDGVVQISYELGKAYDEAAPVGTVIVFDTGNKSRDEAYIGSYNDIRTYAETGGDCGSIFVQYDQGIIKSVYYFK